MKLSVGRINLPHPGHRKIIKQCDFFYLSPGKGRNKLELETRYNYLVSIYPEVATKLRIGTPYSVVKSMSDNDVFIATDDTVSLPKKLGKKYVIIERGGLSSTLVRNLIDSDKFEELKSIYPNESNLEKIIKLREKEKVYCYNK